MKIKKILFISASRSDFYLQKILIDQMIKEKGFSLQLLVTGNHHLKEFGYSIKDVYKERYNFIKEIKIPNNIKKLKINYIFSYLTERISNQFIKNRPDVIILFGDRYEMLSAATCSTFLNIPIIHLHGGEITEGSIDNNIRHSITKMSHFHFVASNQYKKNVEQMGEEPKNIFNYGSLSAERIRLMKKINYHDVKKIFNFKLDLEYFLICIHPNTIDQIETKNLINETIKSLKYFKNYNFVFTCPGFDSKYDYIIKKIRKFKSENPSKVFFDENIGGDLYLNIINYSSIVIGNSSSGIIDAPYFKKPTINIGNRQSGRLQEKSIINCKANKKEIIKSIKIAISNNFKKRTNKIKRFYGNGNTSKKIIKQIKKINLDKVLIKRFFIKK